MEANTELTKAVILMIIVYFSKRIHITVNKEKKCLRRCSGGDTYKVLGIASQWNDRDELNSPSKEYQQTQKTASQKSSPKSWCQDFLLGTHPVSM